MIPSFLVNFLAFMAGLFIFVIGLAAAAVLVLFIVDICQRRNAIHRNYPVLGRLRPLLEHLGIFFRQYLFASDRGELPFNREQRNWVYRAAAGKGSNIAFGSTRDLRPTGTAFFVNCPFPTLETDASDSAAVVVGPHCRHTYATRVFFHMSAMSYGSISKPAVLALSNGARMAGCWLNTGEGGLSPWHLEGGADLVFQIGTAKYSVRTPDGGLDERQLVAIAAYPQVRMFEIKLSQGAKPGKGGILPGRKVTEEIARIRAIPAGIDAVSPNRFSEIDTPAQLLDFIQRVREIIRSHWAIENSLHWVMDMVFRDDECRRRTDHAPASFTTIKHMAHNLVRRASGKGSLRLRRKVAAWDDDFLISLLTA